MRTSTTTCFLLAPLLALAACGGGGDDAETSDALQSDIGGNDMVVRVAVRATFDWVDEERCYLARSYTWLRSDALIGQRLVAGAKTTQAGPAVEYDGTETKVSHVGDRCVIDHKTAVYVTESGATAPAPVDEVGADEATLRAAWQWRTGPALGNAQLKATFDAPIKAKRVYPEYDKLAADGKLAAVVLVRDPQHAVGDPLARETRLANYEAISAKLRSTGYTQASYEFPYRYESERESMAYYRDVARTFTRRVQGKAGAFEQRVDLFSADWNRGRASEWTKLQFPFAQAVFAADLVCGNDSFGVERSIRSRTGGIGLESLSEIFAQGGKEPATVPAWPAHQVWALGLGVSPYTSPGASLQGDAAARTVSAEANVDIVRNVVFTESDKPAAKDATAEATLALFESLATEISKPAGARRSWNEILKGHNEASTSARLTGTRMSDNQWSPTTAK